MVESVHEGEDVPLTIDYTDANGDPIDGDAAPTITVTDPSGTAVVDAVAMTSGDTGTYSHVWDTDSSADGTGPGTYDVVVTGEFGGETKISYDTIDVVDPLA